MIARVRNFIAELRRRKVLRVAAAYLVIAWITLQIAEVTFEPLQLPPAALTFLIVLVVLGFPMAIGLAWAFELAPTGLERDTPAPSDGATPGGSPPARPGGPSVAVLPFSDLSPDRDHDYFCEGVAEEILNTLSRTPDLQVASRTSSFRFKGQLLDIAEIGARLNVATVVEGSVRKAGDQLRITTTLIDVASGYRLWSARYDREMKDIFQIQEEIAGHIATALEVTLHPCEDEAYTDNVQAYDYYLRGWKFFHRTGPRNMAFARDMFAKAIELDPGFARAWAGLADSYGFDYLYYDPAPAKRERAADASLKALELSPKLAEAHASRGFALSLHGCHDEAKQSFEQAIAINPKLFEAWYLYARMNIHAGDLDQAAEHFLRASEVRPEDYQALLLVSRLFLGQGRTAEAKEHAARGLAVAERVLELAPDESRALYLGAGALYLLGQRERGLEWAERALFNDPDDPSVTYNVACFYAQAGEMEKSLDCLEGSNLPGMANLGWLRNDTDLDPVRDHPRFAAIMRNLEQQAASAPSTEKQH